MHPIPLSKQCSPDEKENAVQGMFSSIAHRYDLNNSLLSLGWHHAWKRKAVQMAQIREGMTVLDLCTGTADIAILLAQQGQAIHKAQKLWLNGPTSGLASGGPGYGGIGGCPERTPHGPPYIKVIALDLNEQMLKLGREKVVKQGLGPQVTCLRGNVERLQFKDRSFDVVTVAFGIRNLDHIPKAFAEIYRVLKLEGRMVCLEFSRPPSRLLQKVYDFYSFKILPYIGTVVSGDKTGVYQYLPASIRQFPDQEGLKEIIRAAGFRRVEYLNLTGGIVAIHIGWR
jgi:demethylmenaquinone methyltransferase/2-methoxy-6-polyprenyl-1,4-benzoquinol methylase